jgi:hypothetical protein
MLQQRMLEGMQHSINTHKAYMRKKETEKEGKKETEKDGKKETDSEDKSKRSEGKQNEVICDSYNLK